MLHLDPYITYYIDGSYGVTPISGEISASLVQLQYLEYLNLSYNDFTKIPKFIGAFTNLKYLDLSDNSITGNIPSELGNLTKLRYLDFSWNYITGNIPSELGNLTNLRILDLSHYSGLTANSFKWLSHLSYLRIFKLGGTNFSKAKDWFHSFKTAPSLSTLELVYCQFPELDDSSFSHITNSTNSITTLDVFSAFGSTTVSRLLNLSNNLVDLSLDGYYYFNIESSPIPIPDSFDNLKYLRHLNLGGFDGEVPKSIGSLCRLQELHLSYNEFNSTIIDILESLLDCNNNSLEILNLSRNSLIGPLPRDLSRFLHLRELYVSDNKFSDTLPESIGKLTSLELLDISNNSFSGFVSETHLEKLSKLKHLDLSSNSLTLKMNITWVPPFQLQYINLKSCMIGSQFPSWLQTQSNISYIDLSSNLINSTLPNSLLESNNKSPYVDLSSNKFHGCIPPNLLLKASVLFLSNNTLTCFEPLFCDQIDGTMQHLDLSNNKLFGSIPNCLFHLLRHLSYLNLNNNRLSGVIPSSIASLYRIQALGLRKNNLSGTLPSSMKNCTQLSLLDVGENSLAGTIPKWIGEILTDLVVLQLKSNHFYGAIPSTLCHLQYIQILDISHNRIYGAIPSCMNNFTSMAEKSEEYDGRSVYFEKSIIWKGKEYENIQNLKLFRVIDLSSNKLIGEIPIELTYLVGLNQLNLSRNSLGGAIPQNIGNLSRLESLDLSHNNFSGKIPTGLAELSFLAYLNLSFNHLSGKIPTGTQLQSFDDSSYVENFGLCGLPLLTECRGDHATSRNHELHQEWFDMSWFFIGLEFGFALGFIGVCGASFLNFYRRLAYFRCLNIFEDWLYVMISVKVSKLKRYFNAK
ncbi:receptor-like protein EIX2 [Humulus lupulus]|uniref:receptor-like protein EIX2 n=1 Tax=Humulus lupulus TaxID=3486 RepID=UPI002B40EB34|nr:receptor-like protein EIX2 [Humulus lupulus]